MAAAPCVEWLESEAAMRTCDKSLFVRLMVVLALTFLTVPSIGANADDQPSTVAEAARFSPRDTIRGRVLDEQGQPVPGVRVSDTRGWLLGQEIAAVTDSDGNFKMGAKPGHWRYAALVARTEDGSRQGWLSVAESHNLTRRLEIVLKPACHVRVRVVDAGQQPIANATVEVICSYVSAALGETDATGQVDLSFPADAQVDWVLALKANRGFDYYENYAAFPTRERGPLPPEVQLVLDGAYADVEIDAASPDERPLPGVIVIPWTITKPGKVSYVNCGGARAVRQSTDARGQVHFTWLPQRGEQGFSFLIHSETHHCVDGVHLPISAESKKLAVTLKPNGTIRGKVTFADGSPAPQILLQAEGNGAPHYFRGFARSAEDGSYSFSVYADQTYALNVLDEAWAAPSRVGEVVALGDAPHEIHFRLVPGTVVHGTLTVGADHAPAAGVTATLTQAPQFVRWATTDDSGHYQFRVGPGEYTLSFPDGMSPQPVQIAVTDQATIVHDAHAVRKDRDVLQGAARRADDDRPAAGALILGETIGASSHAGFQTRTDSEGNFNTERWLDRMVVLGRDVNGNLAGSAILTEDDQRCDLKLSPAATIVGRVVDESGKPLANARVQCSLSVPLPGQDAADRAVVRFMAYSAADGKFSLPAVPVGAQCTLYVNWNNHIGEQKARDVAAPQELAVGNIVLMAPSAAVPANPAK